MEAKKPPMGLPIAGALYTKNNTYKEPRQGLRQAVKGLTPAVYGAKVSIVSVFGYVKFKGFIMDIAPAYITNKPI
jgi:hypothetical protein